ncbi:MAG: hydrogenase iron-sulfur subunit [Thermodesulfovibrionales bacterium]|nr:hydrogenase iron-sulfur subunit [Thermodesulfovibrionales bacterium]
MNIGLFISESEKAISNIIDLQSLASDYKNLASVKIFNNLCSSTSIRAVQEEIKTKKLKGVVLAGESPLYYKKIRNGDLLLRTIHEAGINSNMVSFVNLKEQTAMPHRSDPSEATKKAKVLIDVGIERLRFAHNVETIGVTPKKSVAIIGTTIGGLFAANRLLERGYKVHFIDNASLRDLGDFKAQAMPTLAYVKNHTDASFHERAIKELYGYAGNFRIEFEDYSLRAGGIVVAIDDDLKYTEELYPLLRIERNEQGFFVPIISDTATVETVNPGIVVIPFTKNAPLPHIIALSDSASTLLDSLLSKKEIEHELFVSEVDEKVCGGCGTCIKTCIFHAAELDPIKKLSSTNIKRCVGCGDCVSACPTGARDQISAPTKYLISAIKILAQYQPPNGIKVLYLACEGCGYPSLDYAGKMGIEYPTSVLPLSVRCAGRIDTQLILEAFNEGFQGVVVCKCKDDHCLNIVGNIDLDRRANLFRSVLKSRGISAERLRIFGVTECEGGSCVGSAVEFISYLKNIGGMA